MMQVEYTFITEGASEKALVNKLQENLKALADGDPRVKNTKLIKRKNPTGQTSFDSDKQFFYEYDYWFRHRYLYNIFLQMYPNKDMNQKIKFNVEGADWNLYLFFCLPDEEKEAEQDVLEVLLSDLPFDKKLIKVYQPGDDRL